MSFSQVTELGISIYHFSLMIDLKDSFKRFIPMNSKILYRCEVHSSMCMDAYFHTELISIFLHSFIAVRTAESRHFRLPYSVN